MLAHSLIFNTTEGRGTIMCPALDFFYSQAILLIMMSLEGGRKETGPRGPQNPLNPGDVIPEASAPRVHRERTLETYDARDYEGLPIKPLREILASERDAQLFGEALRAIDPKANDILVRYNAGTPSREDMDLMTYATKEYARSLKLAEDVNKLITPQEIELLTRRNTDMDNLMTHEGDARSVEMVKNAIFHIAMKDPDSVQSLQNTFKELIEDRETRRFKKTEKRVEALCGRLNISVKDYAAVFNLDSTENRRATKEDLTTRFHESAGKFRRAIDWAGSALKLGALPGSSRQTAIKAMMQAERAAPDIGPTAWLLRRMDNSLEDIANFIGREMSNPEMRKRVAQETLSNQNTISSIESGPRTFAKTQELNRGENSPASVERRVRERITANREYEGWSPDQQDGWLGGVKSEEMRKQSGGGFWAWLASVLFGQNVNKGINAAAGREVFA